MSDPSSVAPVPSDLSASERNRIETRARRLRAEAARDLFAAVGRPLARALGRWRDARRRAHAIAELRGLGDGMLKDIGMHRSGIVAAVHGLDAPSSATPTASEGTVVAFSGARRRPAPRPTVAADAPERRLAVGA